ncbi:MAG: patatin-like phospholipase family protein [Candidatus Doudnabacteria bacterium]|nr:patatin-like phospholipase family protein [Candidatus Doudnabacteria bacterium]
MQKTKLHQLSQDNLNRPTIGIALSGGSSRAITEVGVLEVFKEHKIPIDYMIGCSSGALVAVAYANNKLDYFKKFMHSISLQKLVGMWSLTSKKGGIFEFGKGEEVLKKLSDGLTFQNSYPKLGFTAADVNTGELVTVSWGEIITAVKASTAVPGLFPPIVLGGKLLVDGGLVNIVPTLPVREMGADIVIGVNVSGARFIYEKKLPYWRLYRMVTKYTGLSYFTRKQMTLMKKILDLVKNPEAKRKNPGIIKILTKALDHSMEISDRWTDADMACDLMITPKVRQWRKTELNSDNLQVIYKEGRRAALEAVPKIVNLIKSHQKQKQWIPLEIDKNPKIKK